MVVTPRGARPSTPCRRCCYCEKRRAYSREHSVCLGRCQKSGRADSFTSTFLEGGERLKKAESRRISGGHANGFKARKMSFSSNTSSLIGEGARSERKFDLT